MADYCTAEDVQVLLGYDEAFDANTRPTLTQVESQINFVTNEIDFTLASVGVTTQPTDTRILGRLAQACQYGSACNVGMSGFGNSDSVNDSQPGFYCDKYQAILDDIKARPGDYGLVTGDDNEFIANQVTDGTYTESQMNDLYQSPNYEV